MNNFLKEHNLKLTKQRKCVLNIINELNDNATLKNIVNECVGKVDASTVYRIIDLFIEKGVFEKKLNYNNEIYYSLKEKHSHYFTCIKCHKRELISDCPLETIDHELESKKGYKILNHIVEIDGICCDCQSKKYIDSLNDEIKAYFHILCADYPEWLNKYIDTKEMQRIGKISMNCGTDYSGLYHPTYWYSNLDHSIAVALIIWNFTHDKKQTLAGLFHDIATPVFKHCIDFMNGDSEHQESTEERTTDIIKNSKEIMSLLEKDNIKLEEVCDYKIYPLADNDMPKLSADRFEYNFSSGLVFKRIWSLNKIKECYNDIIIVKNEDGIDELAFNTKKICEEYIHLVSNLWPSWVSSEDKLVMQFIADIIKEMNIEGEITIDDLYTLSEQDVILKILNSNNKYLSSSFQKFQNATKAYESDKLVTGKYCKSIKTKLRYLVPLVNIDNKAVRINKVSTIANQDINYFLNTKYSNYAYFDFNFDCSKER